MFLEYINFDGVNMVMWINPHEIVSIGPDIAVKKTEDGQLISYTIWMYINFKSQHTSRFELFTNTIESQYYLDLESTNKTIQDLMNSTRLSHHTPYQTFTINSMKES